MKRLERILDLAIQIQQIPAPTFDERERAEFIRDLFINENLNDVEVDALGNVFGRLIGNGSEFSLVVTAHSDTVFPKDNNLSFTREPGKIHGPGIGDNSLGVAGLFGLLWTLKEQDISLPGDLWLVANVCEEGLGDLKGMRAVVDRFKDEPLAYIVVEGMALGQIYHRGLGVQRYRITAKTDGGHSWVDYGKPSAIHELAKLISKLTAIPLPQEPRTSLNVGKISGGTTVNTIAAESSLELDLRSVDPESLSNLIADVESLVTESIQDGIKFETNIIGKRPAGEIPKNHPLVQLASDVLQEQGIQPCPNIGSTDANIPLSLGLPCVCIGLTNGKGAHTVNEFIHTAPLGKGMAQLVEVISRSFHVKMK